MKPGSDKSVNIWVLENVLSNWLVVTCHYSLEAMRGGRVKPLELALKGYRFRELELKSTVVKYFGSEFWLWNLERLET